MGRKRNRRDAPLPKYVYPRGNWYIWRPYHGSQDGRPRFGSPVRLCLRSATIGEVWRAYEAAQDDCPTGSLKWLLTKYEKSPHFAGLARGTQENYRRYARQILERPIADGAQFGSVKLGEITRPVVRQFLDTSEHKINGNRQIQFLKAAFSWALERGHCDTNPCIGVKLHPQPPRTRYVEEWEYQYVLELARASQTPHLWICMELAYLAGARLGEVLRYRTRDVKPNGLLLLRSKQSRSAVTKWTPRLRAAVAAAQALHPSAPTPIDGGWLIHDKAGCRIKESSFKTAWQRLMRRALAGDLEESFRFHDLKARAATDRNSGDVGHKSERMRDVYERQAREEDATR